ncbi:fimbria/pilus outer membrane usher protein [Acidithiobacillus sp. 'AMD consortium']|uniref:fimbria/pilus outer membrane usher protein n=1 Tax=Acidithiobacillus sp. 'AMD consortium' TaxID=2614801 RepID=UPI001CEF8354|nr:fimbria/pilus outer membrane usher protein [Acidithiobacillus sp. 'AMD consortium']
MLAVRDQSRSFAIRFAAAIVVALILMGAAQRAIAGGGETLLLAVVVNGYHTGKIGEFQLNKGTLRARPQALHDLGFKVPKSIPVRPDGRIALSELPDFEWHIDQATQTLYVTVGTKRLLPQLLHTETSPASELPVQSGLGATLDYDVTGTSVTGQKLGAGQFNFRAFSPWGVASSGLLAYVGGGPQGLGTNSVIRLNSTYTYSDPETLRRYRVGDFITGGLSWTRPVRLGGIQISSDFSMRPDLITFPLPGVSGTVAVPSTVNVLVNGMQMLSSQVRPGPFEIPQIPVITGAGTVVTTVTNALGQQVTTTLPFYASANLLAPGLQTFSAGIGFVRLNWGFLSNDYGPLAGSITFRRGLTDALTVEAHAEGTRGVAMAGGGIVVNIDNRGVLNLSAAGSTSQGHTGAQFSVGVQRIGRVFSAGAAAIFADPDFRDIAAMNGDPVPTRQISANVGLSLGRFGSFGISYAGIDRNAASMPIPVYAPPGTVVTEGGAPVSVYYFLPAEHAHILSASYSLQIGPVSFYATGYHDFANSGDSGVQVGVTIPLGSRSSIGGSLASSSGNGSAQVQLMQSPVSIGDWGYQAYATTGRTSQEFGQLQYRSPWGLVSAGASRIDRQTMVQGEVRGALSFMDGGLFASNTINNSFAIVDTDGFGNIRVLDENRLVGRTDSAGQLLVPDLRSYQVNHIAIDPNDVPINATLPYATRDVRPPDRSGVVVKFPIRASYGALLRLVDPSGKNLPVGSVATLQKTGVSVPVGYDGETYVVNLSPHNLLLVERPDGQRCVVTFTYHPIAGTIPSIGPLTCRKDGP